MEKKILWKEFNENSTVDVSDGFRDNVHIVVVSRKFTGKSEKEKQEMLWSIIENSDLSESEKKQDLFAGTIQSGRIEIIRPVRLARLQHCALTERTKVGYPGSAGFRFAGFTRTSDFQADRHSEAIIILTGFSLRISASLRLCVKNPYCHLRAVCI